MLRPGFPRLSHPEVAHAIPSVGFMAQVYRRVRLLVSPTIVGVQLTDQQRTAQAPEHEPSSEGARRRRHSPTGADQARNPVLVGYYASLELPYGAGLDTVRRTWKRLVKKYHPDLYSANEQKRRTATELVQGLNRAYEELTRHLERK